MLRILPVILLIAWGLVMWQFSAWKLRRELDTRSDPLDDPVLEAVTRRLGRAVEAPHMRAMVYHQTAFNGLASPDGRIFITDGVLDQYRLGRITADEVGSIIAHELGHLALGHSKRRMIEWTGQNAARVILSAVLGRLIPFFGVWLAGMLTSLVAARLSRRDAFEADAYAAAVMAKAGVNPEAQISMLLKLEKMAQPPGGWAWLMSHPPVKQRVRAIEALRQRWQRPARDTTEG